MRHFRIQHDRAHRDDDALIAYYVPDAEWFCGVCGGRNKEADGTFCGYCKAEAGTWICDCGHRNPKRSTECEECGTPKAHE